MIQADQARAVTAVKPNAHGLTNRITREPLPGAAPLAVDISIEGIPVCSAGVGVPYDESALALAIRGSELEYEIELPGEGAETEVFFSDLSPEYVRVNAEYTT